jgi:hypothetical protein
MDRRRIKVRKHKEKKERPESLECHVQSLKDSRTTHKCSHTRMGKAHLAILDRKESR